MATLTLMPGPLGLARRFSDISSLKRACIEAIDNVQSQLDTVPGYSEYLKWLVDNAKGNAQYPDIMTLQPALKASDVVTASGGRQKGDSWGEIEKYAAEWLGPIYITEAGGWLVSKSIFDSNSSVDIPSSSIQSGYDFTLNGVQVTVKMPTGTTNTLKPAEIVGDKIFEKFIDDSLDEKMKFYYEVFETLDKESSAAGPWRLVYGTNGNNGLLKELKGNNSTKNMALDPTNFAAGTHPATLRDYWKDIEKDILAWSKDVNVNPSLLEFINSYYQSVGLFGFTFKLDKRTGRGEANFTNVVKSTSIKGKGKTTRGGNAGFSAEKMGITMSF